MKGETTIADATAFESINYKPFCPRVGRAKGRKLITRSGVVLPSKWTVRTIYPNPIVMGQTAIVTLLSVLKRGTMPLRETERPFGIIHSLWTAGYYHWITEGLPRAFLLKKHFPEAVPLLPRGAHESYRESLEAIGFEEVAFFPNEKNVIVQDPVITECPPYRGICPKLLREVRRKILSYYGITPASDSGRIVYVSRRKARGRCVINEDQVLSTIQRHYGCEVVYFEDMSFYDQVKTMANCAIFIGMHGAGLTNMLFMPRGSGVIELLSNRNGLFDFDPARMSFLHDSCYVRLAEALSLKHSALLCPSDRNRSSHTRLANITVDTSELEHLLES